MVINQLINNHLIEVVIVIQNKKDYIDVSLVIVYQVLN